MDLARGAEGSAAAAVGGPEADHLFAAPDALALAAAAAVRGRGGHHNELLQAAAGAAAGGTPTLQPLWRRFFGALGREGWYDLAARMARVQRRLREDGATYNVYAEGSEQARTWPLELLPFLIGADEWAHIERGVRQRARLLDAALADVYGPQQLLREGLLPSQLVHAHAQYLRPMQGAQPAGGRWLHVLGLDLAKGPQGGWWVVGHRTQAPSGMGYLLENRLIIAQQFNTAFRELKVQRLASAFQALLQGLLRASPAGERSRVALLTPGPANETYFEHVFLARYLGLTLVEGSDLTVRDQRLYLKTLHGLERVHVLLRRVDDEWLDPLELRSDSQLGVPGLLQAVRAGELVLANAPGAGLMESPGLSAFWPGVARRLLGEDLLLPGATSWWCGEASVWRAHRQRLADFVVAPSFAAEPGRPSFEPVLAGSLDSASQQRLQAAIDADPAAYTLLAPLRPSEQPVWREGRLEPCVAVVRVYAVADGHGGWRVLPGGLTRVAAPLEVGRGSPGRRAEAADAYLSMQRGSASADTWVLTEGEVDPLSLLPKPLDAADLAGWHRPITSRAAENLFWLGRYTERAETTLRLARLVAEAVTGAHPRVLSVLQQLALRHDLVRPGIGPALLPGFGLPPPVGGVAGVRAGVGPGAGASGSAAAGGAGTAAAGQPAGQPGGLSLGGGMAGAGMAGPVHSGLAGALAAGGNPGAAAAGARVLEQALVAALASGRQGKGPRASVGYALHALRHCAHALRERLSQEHWSLVAQLGERFDRRIDALWRGGEAVPLSEVLDLLGRTGVEMAAITGLQTDRMTRDDGWRLMSVGRMIERLDMLSHALALGFEAGLPASEEGFALLLDLFDSTITYRAQFQARREVPPLLLLLVLDTDNPRSLAWVARTMRDRLRKLARHHASWADAVSQRLPTPELWSLADLCADTGPAGELLPLLHACSLGARALSDEISHRLFSHVAGAEHHVWQ